MPPIDIRLSPSGPVIASGGPGFQLRLAANDTILSTQPITTAQVPLGGAGSFQNFLATLTLPDPTRLYSAKGYFYVAKLTANAETITVAIQLSYAGAAGPWFDQHVRDIPLSDNDNGTQIMMMEMAPVLGSALATPMGAAEASISARLTVQGETDNDATVLNEDYYLEVKEYIN